jgi:hypothetical protein
MKLHFVTPFPIALLLVTSSVSFVAGRIGKRDKLKLFSPSERGIQKACAMDVKRCHDGLYVSRNPENDCKFEECPSTLMCATDVKECKDGSFVSRDPENECQFEGCPSSLMCDTDVKECNDGSFASRDPGNNCNFEEMPFILNVWYRCERM